MFLRAVPEYIFIFAYGLLSVSLNAKIDYRNKNKSLLKEREENEIYQILPFSLCIYGTNNFLKKKDIAMMFLGYCRESKKRTFLNYVFIRIVHLLYTRLEMFLIYPQPLLQ